MRGVHMHHVKRTCVDEAHSHLGRRRRHSLVLIYLSFEIYDVVVTLICKVSKQVSRYYVKTQQTTYICSWVVEYVYTLLKNKFVCFLCALVFYEDDDDDDENLGVK